MAHVIVVGGGPAGAALAFLLARRGIETTLIERQSDFSREFRGEVLMPSGQAVFDELGLREEFDALPHQEPSCVDFYPGGDSPIRLDFGEDLQGGPRIVSQPLMLEMLVTQARAFPCFTFHRGTQASDLIKRGERVCGVRLGDGREILGDLVVGADGRGSVVRRKAGLESPRSAESFDVVWFRVPYPDFIAREGRPVQAYARQGHLALAFPTPEGDELQIAWLIIKGTFGELRRRGVEAWVHEMAHHVRPELGEHLRSHAQSLERPFVLDVVCYLLPDWSVPGAALVGDAAHPMSPVGGQGINIALRDVVVFANHLVPVLQNDFGSADVDEAALAYARERYPEAEEIQAFQRAAPRVIFRQAWWSSPLLQLLRILRFGVIRRFLARRGASRILHGTRSVKLNA